MTCLTIAYIMLQPYPFQLNSITVTNGVRMESIRSGSADILLDRIHP